MASTSSPTGATLAGRLGLSMLSLAATDPTGFDALDAQLGALRAGLGASTTTSSTGAGGASWRRCTWPRPGSRPRRRWSTACSPCAATSRGWASTKLPWTGSAREAVDPLDHQRLPDLRCRHRRHARRCHRHDREADGQDRRVRHVSVPRPQLRRLAGDPALVRAVRRARDPGLPAHERQPGGQHRLGRRQLERFFGAMQQATREAIAKYTPPSS